MRGYDTWKLKSPPLYAASEMEDVDLANYPCFECGNFIEDGDEYEAEYDDGWVLWHLTCQKV